MADSDLPYSFTYDNFLKSMEKVFQSQRDLTAEEIKQAEEHNKNYKWSVDRLKDAYLMNDFAQQLKTATTLPAELHALDKDGNEVTIKLSEWQKLDWDLIRQRINFRLKLDYIKERLQHAGRI